MAQDWGQDIYTHHPLDHARRTPSNPSQTLGEAGRDSPRTGFSQTERIRVTNKYAMDMASKSTYGKLCSKNRKARIETWLERMPCDWQLEDAGTARPITVVVCTDWLNWQNCNARSWLYKLDKFERRFRIAGVQYHKIPHSLRHSVTLPHGPRIDQRTIERLAHILETDRSRDHQPFFAPWIDVYNGVTEVLDQIDACDIATKNIDQVRSLDDKCSVALSKLSKPMRHLEGGLLWLEGLVTKVGERSDQDGSENLLVRHSREGGLFRRWIQTFLEVEHGVVWDKSEYTEDFVGKVASGTVKGGQYWSMLVEGSERNADSMDEG
jgi:hypothetical protein